MINHREEDPRIANDRIAHRSPEMPGEIVSFPASVRDRLARAQALLHQDRPNEALDALQQAGAELARANPELFVLLVARQTGMTKITLDEAEKDVRTVTSPWACATVGSRRP